MINSSKRYKDLEKNLSNSSSASKLAIKFAQKKLGEIARNASRLNKKENRYAEFVLKGDLSEIQKKFSPNPGKAEVLFKALEKKIKYINEFLNDSTNPEEQKEKEEIMWILAQVVNSKTLSTQLEVYQQKQINQEMVV